MNKLNAIPTNPSLASPPWPPDDSHCSIDSIYCSTGEGCTWCGCQYPRRHFDIWGMMSGEIQNRYYAQSTSVGDNSLIKRFTTLVYKRGTGQPTDRIYIGLVDQDTLNDPEKLYNPSTWFWSGYLEDLDIGWEYYFVSPDINKSYPIGEPLFIVAVTNAEYSGGWSIGGHLDERLESTMPLWVYHYEVPGEPNGWRLVEYPQRVCALIYVQGEGQLLEGICEIKNPYFPGTAQIGEPWMFIFDVDQLNAFPCGCPENICWRIIDEDTGNPVGDTQIFNLTCGYTGVNDFWGEITFQDNGTFHGRLEVGHTVGTNCIIDDTYPFTVVVGGGQTYDCWKCDNPPNPCVLHTGLSEPCDGVTYFGTQTACENSTSCQSGEGHAVLGKGITCKYFNGCNYSIPGECTCGDEGPRETDYEQGETVIAYSRLDAVGEFDFYGKTLKHEWWLNDELVWEWQTTCSSHYTGYWCAWTWHGSLEPGIGKIKIYLDGEFLGQTNSFYIASSGEPIGKINNINSYNGPFPVESMQTIADDFIIENIGTEEGDVYYGLYEEGNPDALISGFRHIPAGETRTIGTINTTTPASPGTWNVCIKVWADGEIEPTCFSLNIQIE